MLAYRVDDMTCVHCASDITKAIRAIDAGAKVDVDLQQQLVRVEATSANTRVISNVITEAGYTPVPVEPRAPTVPAARAGGCCCGNGASTRRT